jgi:hypothetical protein
MDGPLRCFFPQASAADDYEMHSNFRIFQMLMHAVDDPEAPPHCSTPPHRLTASPSHRLTASLPHTLPC